MPTTLLPDAPTLREYQIRDEEQITPADPRAGLISINPARVSGVPCFAGTRVPIKHLWDYLEAGETLEDFLEGFPGVTQEQAVWAMNLALQRLLEGVSPQ